LASAVPSKPHAGHVTGQGIRSFTGWTSNLYLVPHEQNIFISMSLPDGFFLLNAAPHPV
jgi:hypothetical protein